MTTTRNRNELVKLKLAAIAYKISMEFDYCPQPDEYEDAKNFYGDFPLEVLEVWQGLRGDEIARDIVSRITKLEIEDV